MDITHRRRDSERQHDDEADQRRCETGTHTVLQSGLARRAKSRAGRQYCVSWIVPFVDSLDERANCPRAEASRQKEDDERGDDVADSKH
jgi:hypothetical protein